MITLFAICTADAESYFYSNPGFLPDSVMYFSRTPGCNIFVCENSIIFDYYKIHSKLTDNSPDYLKGSIEGQVVKMYFPGANSGKQKFEISSLGVFPERSNIHYIMGGNNPDNIKYREKGLILKDIYIGIGLTLYFDNDKFRYDFYIKPGADPTDIEIAFEGIDQSYADNNRIVLLADKGEIIHSDLKSYILSDKNAKNISLSKVGFTDIEIESHFIKKAENSFGFELPEYDGESFLRIDPLVYSTYFGGEKYEYANDMALDDEGNIYITGYTASVNFPVTPGVYQEDMMAGSNGYPDIFVSKFDATGQNLIFSTFIGGFMDDFAEGIAVDSDKNVFITGYTSKSSTFPFTKNAYDTIPEGGYDVFVIKLDSSGSNLLFSTYLGGEKDDYAQDICLDSKGNPYITGYTTSFGGFPVSDFAFQQEFKGEYDIFLAKLTSTGDSLMFSSIYGGYDDDFGQAIKIAPDGNPYVIGITRSDNIDITEISYDRSFNDTSIFLQRNDVILFKTSSNGATLKYSTYLGGAARDGAYEIAIDNSEAVYIAGYTESKDFPVTTGAFDTTYNSKGTNNGEGDIFVTKLNPGGLTLAWSTFIGGKSTERALSLDIDEFGSPYITGYTSSMDFPLSKHPYDDSYNDTAKSDVFLVKLTPDASNIYYSTYFGGNRADIGKTIRLAGDETVWISGSTESQDLPVNNESYDQTYNDSVATDVFLARFYPNVLFIEAGDDIQLCSGESATLSAPAFGGSGSLTYTWLPDQWLDDNHSTTPVCSAEESITYTILVKDRRGNIAEDDLAVEVLPVPEYKIYGARNVEKWYKHTYSVLGEADYSYSWTAFAGHIIGSRTEPVVEVWWDVDISDGDIYLEAENENGCKTSQWVNIKISDTDYSPELVPYGPLSFCKGDSVVLDAGSEFIFFLWSDGTRSRFDTVFTTGNYWVAVTDTAGVSKISDTLAVTVNHLPPKPTIDTANGMLICMEIVNNYQWYFYGAPIEGATSKAYQPTQNGEYNVEVINDLGCSQISDTYYLGVAGVKETLKKGEITVYPNPGDGIFTISCLGLDLFNPTIEVTDLQGNKYFSSRNIIPDDANSIRIDLSQLNSGIYLLKLKDREHIYFRKLIILK